MAATRDWLIELANSLRNLSAISMTQTYANLLEKALVTVEVMDKPYVLEGEIEGRRNALLDATRYGVQQVGFKVVLNDNPNYGGTLGVSPAIERLYNMKDNTKIKLGPLSLKHKKEDDLHRLTLRMYTKDAEIFLCPDQVRDAKEEVDKLHPRKKVRAIYNVKIDLEACMVTPSKAVTAAERFY